MLISFVRKHVLGGTDNSIYAPHIFLMLCLFIMITGVYHVLFAVPLTVVIRAVLSVLILATFVAMERIRMSNDLRAFLSPFLLISYITAAAAYLHGGESLIFIYTIACALISLTYLKPKSLAVYSGTIAIIQFVMVILFNQNLLGWRFTENQNMLGLLASVWLNVMLYIFAKNYSHTLAEATKAKNEATEAAAIKSAFLSNMSHEIRTPLNAIVGIAAIAKQPKNSDPHNREAWEKVENATVHLLGIVNDILDMAKLEAGKLELVYRDFYFRKVIERASDIVSPNINEKSQKLTISVNNNIPAMLTGDDQRLAQVIVNLMGNASKFTATNGSIKISADLIDEANGLCTIEVCVTDSGIGISAEQQAGLFEAFAQAEVSTARKFGGTGLGLSISKDIIDMMDGKIWVESVLGEGASFFFTVKMARSSAAHDNIQAEAADEYDFSVFAGKRLLIAEDIEINREIVNALLEPTGVHITFAENGVQVVRKFSETPHEYDLIFMDIQMPEMDGYEATRQIRALDDTHAKAIPIIAMTANVLSEDVEKCLDSGMNNHIGKPIIFDSLFETLKKHLS